MDFIIEDFTNGSAWDTAQKTLTEFCSEHKDVTFVNAKLEEDCCGYEWEYTLTANFLIKIEGSDEQQQVKFIWSDSGCSCNEMGDTFSGLPSSEPCVIYQNDKWYKLEDTETYKEQCKTKQEEEQKRIERMNLQEERKKTLINALQTRGLELRTDSVLSSNYINGSDEFTIEHIVNVMCQMKYLYEYCNYKDILMKHSPFDRNKREEIKQYALNKYSNGKYPDIFPWEKEYKVSTSKKTKIAKLVNAMGLIYFLFRLIR